MSRLPDTQWRLPLLKPQKANLAAFPVKAQNFVMPKRLVLSQKLTRQNSKENGV